jgi:predicted PurR-regulated permease PerM
MSNNKRIRYLNLLPILLISFIMYRIVNNSDILIKGTDFVISMISPFIWAFAFAYLLNPLMIKIENGTGISRGFAILMIYTVIIGLVIVLLTFVTPQIMNNIGEIIDKMPDYLNATENFFRDKIQNLEILKKYNVDSSLEETLNAILVQINGAFNLETGTAFTIAAFSKALSVTSAFFSFMMGLIISVYMLLDKEGFVKGTKKILYAIFKRNIADEVVEFGSTVNIIFGRYFNGKLLDSIIIGMICLVGLSIMKVEFALLLSIIIGLTNMIPYFGPFFGAIPAVLITIFSNPLQALWVLLFILVLQQFDGLYLGPKILGEKVGLKPFWIILAIVVGGKLFGVMGMLLGAPFTAVIIEFFQRFVNKRLEARGIEL